MNHRIILLLITVTLISGNIAGNNIAINPETVVNELAEAAMTTEINGTISLYSVLKEEIELINTEVINNATQESTNNWQLAYNRDYFISFGDTREEAITPRNFKKIAKKYFANVPELAASIGKRGFRYKNLPTIILYYNKQMQGKALTKEDKLLVKEAQQ